MLLLISVSINEDIVNVSYDNTIIPYNKEALLKLTLAYSISIHKSQGSEWDNVLVFEEGFPYNKEEHKKFLYTSITRAKKRVVIVKK